MSRRPQTGRSTKSGGNLNPAIARYPKRTASREPPMSGLIRVARSQSDHINAQRDCSTGVYCCRVAPIARNDKSLPGLLNSTLTLGKYVTSSRQTPRPWPRRACAADRQSPSPTFPSAGVRRSRCCQGRGSGWPEPRRFLPPPVLRIVFPAVFIGRPSS